MRGYGGRSMGYWRDNTLQFTPEYAGGLFAGFGVGFGTSVLINRWYGSTDGLLALVLLFMPLMVAIGAGAALKSQRAKRNAQSATINTDLQP
jgi:hypothetical protein